jgi:hypothetical protein
VLTGRRSQASTPLVLSLILWVLCAAVVAPAAAHSYDEETYTYDVGLNGAAHAARSVGAPSTIVFFTDAVDVNQVSASLDYSYATNGLGALDDAAFVQTTFRESFSAGGTFAGQTIDDVAAGLRSGALAPGDVPIQVIVRDGNTLILNTRSAQALTRAGIPQSDWLTVNMTGNAAAEARLTGQLARNGLDSTGFLNPLSTGK